MPRTPKDPNAPAPDPRIVFIKAANGRTSKAIRALANVAKLPTKGRKPSDAANIAGALRKALDQVEARLLSGATADPEFKLPE